MKTKYFILPVLLLLSLTFIMARPLTCSDDGIVSLWKFDDGSGAVAIDSCGSNNGAVQGTQSWGTGIYGGAFDFNKVDNFIRVPSDASLIPNANNYSISAWVKTDVTQTNVGIVDFYDDIDSNEYLLYMKGDIFGLYTSDNSVYPELDGTTSITDGEWHNIIAVRDGEDLTIYLDGSYEGSLNGTGLGTVTPNTAYFTIGTYSVLETPTNYGFNGSIDDVAYFNKALSPSEVLNIYEEAETPVEEGTGNLRGGSGGGSNFEVVGEETTPETQEPIQARSQIRTFFSNMGENIGDFFRNLFQFRFREAFSRGN